MSKQKIFLIGATGETGGTILGALVEDGSFDIICFIRTSSAGKPAVQELKNRGLKVVTGDLSSPVEEIVPLLRGIDIVISTVFSPDATTQFPLIDAAVKAGVKRFLPCTWATPAARGGILNLVDSKEQVHDHIFRHRLPFTIIDVGWWYVAAFPKIPSGKFDYASIIPNNELYAGGNARNMMLDKKDVGRITVQIIKDERTLNKRVYAYGEVLSQNEILAIIEKKTGEMPELIPRTVEYIQADCKAAVTAAKADPTDIPAYFRLVLAQYAESMHVRFDNTPENCEYLGYISARELYPDFKFKAFSEFVDDLVAGKVERPYPERVF